MTRKHIIGLADAVRLVNGTGAPFTQLQLDILADFCKAANPNFQRQRWMDYIAGKCTASGKKIT